MPCGLSRPTRTTITARVLEMYGVTAEIIAADLQKFAVADDFRSGIQVQMLDFSADSRPEPRTSRTCSTSSA